jgi:hypothetical protein
MNARRARALRRVFGVKHVHQIPRDLRHMNVPLWVSNKHEVQRRAEVGIL